MRKPRLLGLMFCTLALALLPIAGCATYELRGVVVVGKNASLIVVDEDDARLKQPGIEGADVQVVIDPQSLNRTILPEGQTDSAGRFAIPVKETGAGFLEYQAMVATHAPGHRLVTETIPLPPANKRLLITLPTGRDTYRPQDDILNETLRMGGHKFDRK